MEWDRFLFFLLIVALCVLTTLHSIALKRLAKSQEHLISASKNLLGYCTTLDKITDSQANSISLLMENDKDFIKILTKEKK